MLTKAVATNAKFLISLQWWTWLVETGILPDSNFIQPVPHITFASGSSDVEWLKKRVQALTKLPSFAATEYVRACSTGTPCSPRLSASRDHVW